MPRQFGDAARNAMADAYETAVGASPFLQVRSGPPPVNCAAADVGTLIAEMPLPSDWLSAAAAGVKSLLGTWQDTSADATGLAGHYRIKNNLKTITHEQDVISEAHATNKAYVVGQQVHNGSNVYRCVTAGTSGNASPPTGTGTGIADGTVVWDYLAALGMTMVNTNINATQLVTVSGYTLTMPGA